MQQRKEHGLTQEELSEKIGFSKNHLSNIETGKYMPTTKFIFDICNVLGKTPDYYLIGSITEESAEITKIVQLLPIDKQRILQNLLKAYLEEISI